MAAPDRQGMLVLEGTAPQHRKQCVEISHQDVGRLRQLHRKAGVEHVARRHALMDKASIGADMLGKVRQKGDHVVAGFALDLIDALDLERAAFPDGARRVLRDDSERRLSITGMRLDLEPDPVAVLRRPDSGHLGTAVAGDHSGVAQPRPAPNSVRDACCGLSIVRQNVAKAMLSLTSKPKSAKLRRSCNKLDTDRPDCIATQAKSQQLREDNRAFFERWRRLSSVPAILLTRISQKESSRSGNLKGVNPTACRMSCRGNPRSADVTANSRITTVVRYSPYSSVAKSENTSNILPNNADNGTSLSSSLASRLPSS